MPIETLGVYLNDHLGGSATGIELVEKLRDNHEGTPFGTVLVTLAEEIKADRKTLEDLIDRLGVGQSTVKHAVGWVAEKVTRLKTDEHVTGSADLSQLLETETLSLGIEGKLLMWRALKAGADADPRLALADYDQLIERAGRQRTALEPYRVEAAVAAFTKD
jgi:hypothetical protein